MRELPGEAEDDDAVLGLVAAVLAPGLPSLADVVMAGRAAWRAFPVAAPFRDGDVRTGLDGRPRPGLA